MIRRGVVFGAGSLVLAVGCAPKVSTPPPPSLDKAAFEAAMQALEAEHGGEVGLMILSQKTGQTLGWREGTRFAYCSVFKWVLAAACLKAAEAGTLKLDQSVSFSKKDLLNNSPVTKARLKDGAMTVAELCAATVIASDNAAANLLTPLIGGLEGLRAFVAHYGDTVMRFDRMEPELNTNLPNDPRDTSTPAAMTKLLYGVLNLEGLNEASKAQLRQWMQACETGDKRIRAGVPPEWTIGDKTGTSGNGAANDVAFFSLPSKGEYYLSVFSRRAESDMDASGAFIAAATKAVMKALAL